MPSHQVALVPFRGTAIPTAKLNGIVHVFMKPVAEAIGVPWAGQRQRINRHPVLKSCASIMLAQLPGDRQAREHVTLPMSYLNGWLFTISAERANETVRDRLIAYQRECFDVLDAYWRRGFVANPRLRTIADGEQPHDGLGKMTGDRFAEERAKFEAREGIPFLKAIEGMGILSPRRLRAIERDHAKIDDALFRWLVGYGFDLHYILYGKRVLTEAERAVRDVMRLGDETARADLIAHAETIALDATEMRDAHGDVAFLADRHRQPIGGYARELLN